MKYTYDIQEDWKGWSAKSYIESEKLKDTIFGLAITNPSTFLGITSDGRFEFVGCAIRIEKYYSGPFCAKVSVEFHDNYKCIKQGFVAFWMLLYDERIVLGEPTERIPVPSEIAESEQEATETRPQDINSKLQQYANKIRNGKKKLPEKMKRIFLAVVIVQRGKIGFETVSNSLSSMSAHDVDEIAKTRDSFRAYARAQSRNKFFFDDEASLFGKVKGLSPENLVNFYYKISKEERDPFADVIENT